jgi:thiosulfate/3-mercaptopyruvate sulfurtransferase
VEWSDAITEDGRFRPADELRELYRDLPEGDAAAYCQACVRGAHGVFTLALAGRAARAYDGSMAEWANRDDTPLE